MKKFSVVLLSVLCAVGIAAALIGCSNNGHVHSFDKQVVSEEYLAEEATCTEKAKYYYSCDCGAKGTETFEYGSTTNHNYVNGVCTYCGKEQQTSQGLEFTLLDDGTYEVSGIGSCTDTEIVIPCVHNDKPVTAIGSEAFKKCKQLKSVIIPEGVTIIKKAAFSDCSGLISVTMPSSIITIGDNAFCYCYYIETVIPDNVVTIGDYAFYFCEMINTEIVIPKSVVNIGAGAFAGCTKVERITVDKDNPVYYSDSNCIIEKSSKTLISGCKNSIIPNGVIAIADSAFECCFRLISVTIPDSVTTISGNAFWLCQNLTSVVIGKSVKSIGSGAFEFCCKLIEVINKSDIEITKGSEENGYVGCYALNIKNGGTTDIVNKDDYLFYTYEKVNYLIGYADTSLNEKSLILPESYNGENYEIYQFAFNGYYNLTEVIIPDCVTRIGDCAFMSCVKLTKVSIPDNVENVSSATFMYSPNMQYNEYGNLLYLGNSDNPYAFLLIPQNIDITSCIINKNTKSIESGVFAECTGLTSIIVEKDNPIYYSENNCVIEKSSKKLIAGCRNSIIPNDVKIIGDYAFNNCSGLKSITIPDSVTSIGERAFEDCSGLISVVIGNGVINIGEEAFDGCTGLKSVIIPDSVTSIGERAFDNCTGLISVVIGNGVTSIGRGAFSGCSELINVTVGNSVENIELGAFSGCRKITNIHISSIESWCKISGLSNLRWSHGKCKLYLNGKEITELIIPDGVMNIGDYAFFNSGITSVTISDSVTSIGEMAFTGCNVTSINISSIESWCKISGLGNLMVQGTSPDGFRDKLYLNGEEITELIIPDSVTSIGDYAFYNCLGLTSIIIPGSITSMGDYAFYNCRGLTSIIIPSSITSIGDYTFYYCGELENITYQGTIAEWKNITKGNSWYYNSSYVIHCTDGDTYCGEEQAASQGLEFTLLDDDTYKVSGIGSCTDTEIVIPSMYNNKPITRIGEYAFSGYNLTSVIIPNTVIGINWHAFEGCSALMSVTIPGSVTTIGEDAFSGSGLTSVTIEKGVSYIGRYAFTGCVRLVSVSIPDSVESIGEGAFFYCLKLVEVVNNSNLNIVQGSREYGDIGSYALNIKKGGTSEIVNKNNYLFYTSENVNYLLDYIGKDFDLTLPSDYNGQSYQIYDYAFAVRDEFTRIAIPDKVTVIGYAAFMGCSGIESITVSAGNTTYSSINNCLIDTASGTLIFGCKNSVIPNDGSITTIGDGAFNLCNDLTSIIIPGSIISVGDYAFGSNNITNITYKGTIAEWKNIKKGNNWNSNIPEDCVIHCIDGDIKISD